MARAADRLAQRVVPPDPRQIAWISDPDYVGNAFHLFRHVRTTRSEHRHVWLVGEAAGRVPADGTEVRVVRRRSMAGYVAFLRSGTVFHTHGVYPMTTSAHRRRVVSLWHGMPIKAIGALNTRTPNPHPTFGTVHVATSTWFRGVIARAFRVPEADVLVSGLPRCDVLTTPHPAAPARDEIRARLGIDADRHLVVWMPTYRVSADRVGPAAAPHTFLDDLAPGDLDDLDELAERHATTIVVKLHPYDPLGTDHGKIRPPLRNVRFLGSDEFLATGIELYDLLAVADGLLSDVSSVLIDHLVTTRPAGVVGFVASTYERDTVVDFDELVASDRFHDLADPAQRVDFFAAVASGREILVGADDVSRRWYDAPAGGACEAVLAALGI